MKSMLKEAAILFVITLISGCLLGLVYDVTKEPIEKAQAEAKEEASKEVFADAASFVLREDLDSEAATAVVTEAGFKVTIDEVSEALDAGGTLLGYVITVTDHEGYGGDIQFSMGIRNDGTLNGISILQISETAGLGMKADPVLKEQFAADMDSVIEDLNKIGGYVMFLGDGVPVQKAAIEEKMKAPFGFAPANCNRQKASSLALQLSSFHIE